MNIHEYQAKDILRKFGVTTLKGETVSNVEDARRIAQKLGGPVWVVKAQIHAGGRGKGGGVKLARSLDEVTENVKKILGMSLVTHQTGPEGKIVHTVFIEEGCNIAKEYYVATVIDRATSQVAMMASTEGGVDIEEVAAKHPEKIFRVSVDPAIGMMPFQARQLVFKLGIPEAAQADAIRTLLSLYKCFEQTDCSLAEINPMVLTKENKIIALDAKLNFDDNALFRHKEISEMRDFREEDPAEVEASRYDLAFIKLDGDIGCLVNGAGLAMATLDIIKLHGGEPANFLDVGGGANKEKVTQAFKIILKDPNVKAILVNIFGGIMKCDIIAEGVVAASKELGLKVPLIVRLAGTNVERGRELLEKSGLNITSAADLTEAAIKVVTALKPKNM